MKQLFIDAERDRIIAKGVVGMSEGSLSLSLDIQKC